MQGRLGAGLVVVSVVLGCSLAGGTLGRREKCWSQSDARVASLMKGNLRLAAPALDTAEEETLQLSFSGLTVRREGASLALVDRRGAVAANDGELVTVFGGLGSDGSMLVCAVEERHSIN